MSRPSLQSTASSGSSADTLHKAKGGVYHSVGCGDPGPESNEVMQNDTPSSCLVVPLSEHGCARPGDRRQYLPIVELHRLAME